MYKNVLALSRNYEIFLNMSNDKDKYKVELHRDSDNNFVLNKGQFGSTNDLNTGISLNTGVSFPNSGITSLLTRPTLEPLTVNSPLTIHSANLKEEIQERWETYDTEDFNSLRKTIKQKILTYNDNPNDPSPKVIRKLAEELNVYSVTLKKFVKGEDLSKIVARKFFNKLVHQIDEVTLGFDCYINNNVSFMRHIANKKIDAIVIEHNYPENKKLSKYQERIIAGYNLIEEKWRDFWDDYPSKKVDQIKRYASFEDDINKDIQSFVEDKNMHLYFKILPHFMQRRLPKKYIENKNLNDSSGEKELKIGLFYIYCGFDDQWQDDEGNIYLDQTDTPIEIPGFEEVSYTASPDLEDVIFKKKLI